MCMCVCACENLWHPEWRSDRRYDPLRRLQLSDLAVILESTFPSFISSEETGVGPPSPSSLLLSFSVLVLSLIPLISCYLTVFLLLLLSLSILFFAALSLLLFSSFARILKRIDTLFSSHSLLLWQKREGHEAYEKKLLWIFTFVDNLHSLWPKQYHHSKTSESEILWYLFTSLFLHILLEVFDSHLQYKEVKRAMPRCHSDWCQMLCHCGLSPCWISALHARLSPVLLNPPRRKTTNKLTSLPGSPCFKLKVMDVNKWPI